jgi:hypothetical protein
MACYRSFSDYHLKSLYDAHEAAVLVPPRIGRAG